MKSSKKAKKSGKVRVDREQLLAAIRKAVEGKGGGPFGYKDFLAASGMRAWDIWRHFPKWSEAMKAAGFDYENPSRRGDDELLGDWGRTARKLGHAPSCTEYKLLGGFNETTLKKRFGGEWPKVMEAFRCFAMKSQEWMDVLAMLPEPGEKRKDWRRTARGARRGSRPERQAKSQALKEERQISGDPLYCEGMSHAPVNEMGVMVLFGAMAAKLGFMVESVRKGFPDCQAKRRIGPDAWVTLRIEFEYESRNFRDHGHPPGGCDMIVCWVHNWPDCPPGLKVIALSEELARLRRERMMIAF